MNKLQAGFQTPPVDLPFTDYGKAVEARRAFGRMVAEGIAQCRRPSQSVPAAGTPDSALADIVAAATGDGTGAPLPDSLLIDNAAAAFFGNASTGPSLAKALQHLASSPHVLERLRLEQQEMISRHGTAVTAEVLDEMPYASAVAKELLRITPAVPAVFRVAAVDFELEGSKVPKGWRVWCHLGDSVLKYNKDVFDPDRWGLQQRQQQQQQQLPDQPVSPTALTATPPPASGCPAHAHQENPARNMESAAQAGPEYSLPFGAGVRMCLGRNLVVSELLVVLAVLARGCEWEALTPGEEWRLVPAPAPKNGLLVNLRRRK